MVNRSVITLGVLLALALAAPLHADIRYTMRIQVRDATQAPATTPPPALAELLARMIEAIVPGGSASYDVAAAEEVVRVQFHQATAEVPKGGVLLLHPDGRTVIMDPASRTYWTGQRLPRRSESLLVLDGPPTVTGETTKVSGVRAERVTFTGRLELAASPGKPLPTELVDALQVVGEVWATSDVRAPEAITDVINPAARAFGLGAVVGDRFIVRQVLGGPFLAGQALEMVVHGLNSRKVPADLMQIPKDYREVPPPASR
jgi:hypothetical protein